MSNRKNKGFIAIRAKKTSERPLRSEEESRLNVESVPFPENALIELTSNCNHACVFCKNPRMKRKSSKLDINLFKKFIGEAVKLGLKEVGFYTTGEPLVHKNLLDFIKIAKESGVGYIYITTNGALAKIEKMKILIDAGLNSIKFSINAGSRETYSLVHGRDHFDDVINNLKNLKKYIDDNNKEVKILSSFVVTKQSIHEIDAYKHIVSPLVDDYEIMGVKSQSGQSLQQLKELNCDLSPSYPEEGLASPCSMLWNRVHLTQEGYLSLCCVDYENELIYADLNKTTLKEAWNSAVINNMRKRHLSQKLKGTLCHNCLYGVEEPILPILGVEKTNRNEKLFKRGNEDVSKRIKSLNIINQTTGEK